MEMAELLRLISSLSIKELAATQVELDWFADWQKTAPPSTNLLMALVQMGIMTKAINAIFLALVRKDDEIRLTIMKEKNQVQFGPNEREVLWLKEFKSCEKELSIECSVKMALLADIWFSFALEIESDRSAIFEWAVERMGQICSLQHTLKQAYLEVSHLYDRLSRLTTDQEETKKEFDDRITWLATQKKAHNVGQIEQDIKTTTKRRDYADAQFIEAIRITMEPYDECRTRMEKELEAELMRLREPSFFASTSNARRVAAAQLSQAIANGWRFFSNRSAPPMLLPTPEEALAKKHAKK